MLKILSRFYRGEDLGEVDVRADHIAYHSKTYSPFQTSLGDIAVLGEYTNESGPWLEDHFLVLVLRDQSWRIVPRGASGVDRWCRLLEGRLGMPIVPALIRAEFASRIIWPEYCAGCELFVFAPKDEGRSKPVYADGAAGQVEISLTPTAVSCIERTRTRG